MIIVNVSRSSLLSVGLILVSVFCCSDVFAMNKKRSSSSNLKYVEQNQSKSAEMNEKLTKEVEDGKVSRVDYEKRVAKIITEYMSEVIKAYHEANGWTGENKVQAEKDKSELFKQVEVFKKSKQVSKDNLNETEEGKKAVTEFGQFWPNESSAPDLL